MRKPGIFDTYEGCFVVLLWSLVIWALFAFAVVGCWRYAT